MLLLKNGFIVDGSGASGFTGDLLLDKGKIKDVSSRGIKASCPVRDCSGRVVAPGFIDIHSHNDWFLTSSRSREFIAPFLEQGITTFVAGNCGFSMAGFKKGTKFRPVLEDNLFKMGHDGIHWDTLREYHAALARHGAAANIMNLCGNGTARVSMRGYDPSPLNGGERKDILAIMEEAMDHGAAGVSFGMGYAPDIFTTPEEREDVARLVKKRNGVLAVHVKAFSKISGAYPVRPFGEPHNLIAIREFLDLARKTGVRLQISHLIFVGRRTWGTLERALEMIDRAIDEGVDVRFDTYAHHCGATVISGILPDWFMAGVPGSYTNPALLRKARILMKLSFFLLGFNMSDMQLAAALHPDLEKYNGMFFSDISRARKVPEFDNYMEFARLSNSTARMLLHKYSDDRIVLELMKHRASHFMTDAWIEPMGLQNPATYGCFPRFLELARSRGVLSLEEVVHKMTGKNAERMGMSGRGLLKKGCAADVTVFDWDRVKDNTSAEDSSARPEGIESVFVNGIEVVKGGKAVLKKLPGEAIRK